MRHSHARDDKGLGNAGRGVPTVPHHVFGPPLGSPRLALVGGFGASDFDGVSVLSRLASFLRRVDASGETGRWRLAAPIIVVPAALELQSTAHRQFGTAETLAGIEDCTSGALRRIAIRSSDRNLEHLPQVRLETPDEDEREAACLFGLPVVEESGKRRADRSLGSAWRAHGGESFDIVVGRSGQLEPIFCESVFRAILAFMGRVGLLHGVDLAEDETDLHYFEANRLFDLRCGARGLFVTHRNVGEWLQAGDTVGSVYDAFDGDPRHEVCTPVGGLLSALRRQPLVEAGASVARVLANQASKNSSSAF